MGMATHCILRNTHIFKEAGVKMKTIKCLWLLILFATFSSPLFSASKAEISSTKTAVIFNTLCAKCHEGECSGRLSYDTGSSTIIRHIKRYAEDTNISKEEIVEFFGLLNYMKTECALWMPDNGKWDSKNLMSFALPSAKGYFIPLGILKEGKYHVEIKIKDKILFKVEVFSDYFEHYLHVSVSPDEKEKILQFTIDRPANIFLRIQSKEPLQIIDLEIKKDN